MKRWRLILILLCALALLPGCGEQDTALQEDQATEAVIASPQNDETTAERSVDLSDEASIVALLSGIENNASILLWGDGLEEPKLPELITIYETEKLDGQTIWNELLQTLLPGAEIISTENIGDFGEDQNITFTINGKRYLAAIYNAGDVEIYPAPVSAESALTTLCAGTGMDYVQIATGEELTVYYKLKEGITEDILLQKMEEDPESYMDCFDIVEEASGSAEYAFTVDELNISTEGYGESIGPNVSMDVDSSFLGISNYFRLGQALESVSGDSLFSLDLTKTLVQTYVESTSGSKPSITKIDQIQLVYYCDWNTQKLLPGWSLTGTKYSLSNDGALRSFSRSYLLDAQTGEILR